MGTLRPSRAGCDGRRCSSIRFPTDDPLALERAFYGSSLELCDALAQLGTQRVLLVADAMLSFGRSSPD
jgi:hypothetical protein